MNDWIGLGFLLLLGIGIFFGLRTLAKPQRRSPEEFEKRAAEGAGITNAGFNALNKLLNPEADKGTEIVLQVKEGRFGKKKREGKGDGKDSPV